MQKKVLVGVVGFNSSDTITSCLQSVFQQDYKNIKVIYYDNFSQDQSVSIVLSNFPSVECIQHKRNIGYGNAHNFIIENYEFDYYMPLNPDVILQRDFIRNAVDFYTESTSQIGAVNGLIYHLNDGEKTDTIYSCGHIMHRDRRIDNLFYGQTFSEVEIAQRIVFGPNGACPVLSREMINAVSAQGHFFEPLFFMYGDDIDVGWRMVRTGWVTVFLPECKAWHSIGGSRPFRNRKIRIEYIANRYLLILKNDHLILFLRDFPIIFLVEVIFICIHMTKRPGFLFDLLGAFVKVFRHLVFFILSRKGPYPIKKMDTYIEKKTWSRLKRLLYRQTKQKNMLKTF